MRRRLRRRADPNRDLRLVYFQEDEIYRRARALADARGVDEVRPGESEDFARQAQALARAVR